jgi:hypothetical protein
MKARDWRVSQLPRSVYEKGHPNRTQTVRPSRQRQNAYGEGVHSELARVLVTSLRDGCDLLDVVGRRLQRQVSA